MRTLARTLSLAAALALAGPTTSSAGDGGRHGAPTGPGSTVVRAHAGLVATTARPATGSFSCAEKITADGREKASFEIEAAGLDASRGDDGLRVPHGVYLLPVGGGEVLLGNLQVDGKGRSRLARRNAGEVLGPAATPLRRQAGAVVEVRGPNGTVLRGTLPAFDLDGAGTSADRRETYGLFVPTSSAPQSAPGRFTFRTDVKETGETRNRAVIQAPGLPHGYTYTVYLFSPRTVLLGTMENHPNLGATLSLDSRRAPIPGDITNWKEFDGSRIEVRRGGTIMLRGAISIFQAATEEIADTGSARSRATVELGATAAGGVARALLTASVRALPRRRDQEIRVRAFDLPPAGNPYAVATLEPDGVRHLLGRFDTRGDAAAGGFRVSTRRGGSTPPGGVLGQAGRPVEVTDVWGTVVLTGTFPTLD